VRNGDEKPDYRLRPAAKSIERFKPFKKFKSSKVQTPTSVLPRGRGGGLKRKSIVRVRSGYLELLNLER
jgi:hypothetical protein